MSFLRFMLLVALLIISNAALAASAPTARDRLDELSRGSHAGTAILQVNEQTIIVAPVKEVDRLHGIVYLESKIGRIVTMADPREVQDLHAGDQIIVVVADEDPTDNLLQDSIIT